MAHACMRNSREFGALHAEAALAAPAGGAGSSLVFFGSRAEEQQPEGLPLAPAHGRNLLVLPRIPQAKCSCNSWSTKSLWQEQGVEPLPALGANLPLLSGRLETCPTTERAPARSKPTLSEPRALS